MKRTPKKAPSDRGDLLWVFGACAFVLGINELWHYEIVKGLTDVVFAVGSCMIAAGCRQYLIPAIGLGSVIGLSLGGNHPTAFAIGGGMIGFLVGYVHDLVETPLPTAPVVTSSENGKR